MKKFLLVFALFFSYSISGQPGKLDSARIQTLKDQLGTLKGKSRIDFLNDARLKNNKKIVVSRTLKEIEELLEEHSFARVHRCYLANLNEVERYVKGEGGYLVMSDGSTIDVARNKKEVLLKKLLPYKD